jgi:hypothetical protein
VGHGQFTLLKPSAICGYVNGGGFISCTQMTATSAHFEKKNAHGGEHVAFRNAHIIFPFFLP